jgi:hypothetical protein
MISIINSKYGPTDKQIDGFQRLIQEFDNKTTVFAHGMSEGDIKIHALLTLGGFETLGYPALNHNDLDKQDFPGIKEMEIAKIADRNKQLVDKSAAIIALPQMMNEWEDSPQWKTIRFAISKELEIYIITPIAGYIYKRI